MRLCLLRRQSERQSAVFRPHWSVTTAFSFNSRFWLVLASVYSQRRYRFSVQNFSDVPGKPGALLVLGGGGPTGAGSPPSGASTAAGHTRRATPGGSTSRGRRTSHGYSVLKRRNRWT